MEAKDYMLVGVCVVAAILLFVRMAKENKVFIGAGLLCLCYGGYHVAKAFFDSNIVNILGWVLRGIAVIMLIWIFTVLSGEKAKAKAAQAEAEAQNAASSDPKDESEEVPADDENVQ